MADPFIGELRMWGFAWAPQGWATCNGQLLSIASQTTLYSLLGTNFGGDGRNTFALPNLQSRVPVHRGDGVMIGMAAGMEEVTLTLSEIPAHSHDLRASGSAQADPSPADNAFATFNNGDLLYADGPPNASLGVPLLETGSGLPHQNVQPSLVVNFTIAMVGIYPSRSLTGGLLLWQNRISAK